MQNKKILNKMIIFLILVASSVFIDVFACNYKYWTNDKITLGTVLNDKIKYQDITDRNGRLKIVGENPYFKIEEKGYCGYLSIDIKGKQGYGLSIQHMDGNHIVKEKIQKVRKVGKNNAIIEIKDNLENVRFVPVATMENDLSHKLYLGKVSVIDNIEVNYYRIFALISSFMLVFVLVAYRKKLSENLHIAFLLLAITVGLNICIMNPMHYSYDEKEHFIRAYEVSRFDFGLRNEVEHFWIDNADKFLEKIYPVHQNNKEKSSYVRQFSSAEYPNKEYFISTASTYPFVPYIMGGLGILIGRMLHLPFVWTFYLGRIISMLGYVAITAWCIKNIKFGKKILFLLALLPALIFLTTAYSADTYTLAAGFFAMTLWINMIVQNGRIQKKQMFGFAGALAVMIMCKVTYAPLCLLFFSVSSEKFNSKMQAWKNKILVLLSSGVVAIGTFLYSNSKGLNQWNMPGTDVGGQIKYIFAHPIRYICLVGNDMAHNINVYLTGVTTSLAYNKPLPEVFIVILVVILCVIAVVNDESEQMILNKKTKGILLFSIISSWGLISTALYITFTPVGSMVISGIQGRYFAPLLFPVLLLLKNNKIYSNINANRLNMMLIGTSAFFLLWEMWSILNGCCG